MKMIKFDMNFGKKTSNVVYSNCINRSQLEEIVKAP